MTKILIEELTLKQIATICDHTFLNRSEAFEVKAEKGQNPIKLKKKAFQEFLEQTLTLEDKPYSLCVRPEDVRTALAFLKSNGKEKILIVSVVGFPDGAVYDTSFKVAETELAISHGAKEIDMVLDYDKLKEGNLDYVYTDIHTVVTVAHNKGVIVKVIFETSELDSKQIKTACQICEKASADFVKTSTGFSASGAKAEDLKIMRENFSKGVKMSGEIKITNVKELLRAASGREDGYIELNPAKIRIGESSLLKKSDGRY